MIDTLSGTVSFEHWSLDPNCDEAVFAAITAGHPRRTQRTIGAYRYHTVPDLTLANTCFNATFSFHAGRLESISLTLPAAHIGWDHWDEADERQRKKDQDTWLEAQLGPGPYDYGWGVVSSHYSPQSGASAIIVRYR